MSEYAYKSHTYTIPYSLDILSHRIPKRKQTSFGNYPKKLWNNTVYNTFDGFVMGTNVPYIIRKAIAVADPWGPFEVILNKRQVLFKDKSRPPKRQTYNKPKEY